MGDPVYAIDPLQSALVILPTVPSGTAFVVYSAMLSTPTVVPSATPSTVPSGVPSVDPLQSPLVILSIVQLGTPSMVPSGTPSTVPSSEFTTSYDSFDVDCPRKYFRWQTVQRSGADRIVCLSTDCFLS
jgi:hypothetical protein